MAAIMALSISILGMLASDAAWAGVRGKNYFPNLPLVTQDGKTVMLWDDLIKDKIVVFNFFYASCQDICPLMTARMTRVAEALGDRLGRDIFMYSITLEPETDTPEVLKKYAEAYNVKPGWLLLTGKLEDINRIRYKLGERSRSLDEHRNDVVLGNGTTLEWARSSVFQDLERLVEEINNMDPVWRAQKRDLKGRSFADAKPMPLAQRQGQALFLKACASCHSIGKGDIVGPDLAGVTARRDRRWLTRFMMYPDMMRDEEDPIALELSARYGSATMPFLGLSEIDAKDLLFYVDAQTKLLEREKTIQ